MKYLIHILIFALVSFAGSAVYAQDEGEEVQKENVPIRPMFESAYLIDNQSVLVYPEKTLEFVMQHRFGLMDNGISDIYGLFGPANIRLGLTYVPIKNLAVGFGTSKNKKYQDFNLKYAIVQQTRSGSIPVSVTYFGDMAIDSRSGSTFLNSTDRFSYFHQVIIARKVTPSISLQLAPSYSHFNSVEAFVENESIKGKMNNDHIALGVSGRIKLTDQGSLIFDYNQPITEHFTNNPHPNLSLGFEVSTSSHAFQVFFGNYWGIVPQENNVFNTNDFENGDFLIGFNITRLWSF